MRHDLRPAAGGPAGVHRMMGLVVALALGVLSGCASDGADDETVATTLATTTVADTTVADTTVPVTTLADTTVPVTTLADTTVPATTPSVSPGCSAPATGPLERIDVTVDGQERFALAHVPAGVPDDVPLPVVLAFHGFGASADLQRQTDGLVALADAEGFVVAHPEGLSVGVNEQIDEGPGWDPEGDEVDELAFVEALLEALGEAACIDPGRVFTTGLSAGGYMALAVACGLPGRVVAAAPVAAAYQSTGCPTGGTVPVPVLAFHGMDDLITPFDGRTSDTAGTFVPVLDALAAQAERNGCDLDPVRRTVSATVTLVEWSDCDWPAGLYVLDEHGHAWPGHPLPVERDVLLGVISVPGDPGSELGNAIGISPEAMADDLLLTNTELDATAVMWEFFSSR